jgi:hypothetical protein
MQRRDLFKAYLVIVVSFGASHIWQKIVQKRAADASRR